MGGGLPNYFALQEWTTDSVEANKLPNKASKVVSESFTQVELAKIQITLLSVHKGDNKIPVIYNTTKCSLNDAL